MSPLADTTVLNNFAQILACDWSWLKLLDLTEQEQVRADEAGRALDPGEAACIAVASSRGLLMLSDGWEARALGRSLGLEVSGSLGVLDRLVGKQILTLDEADTLLAEMVRRGFRSPYRSLREIPR
jgi:predicted nucleic acid-binding protein